MVVAVRNLADLSMAAAAADGQPLASAGPLEGPSPAESSGSRRGDAREREFWWLQVQPNADAVLILSCMLALHLLPVQAPARRVA